MIGCASQVRVEEALAKLDSDAMRFVLTTRLDEEARGFAEAADARRAARSRAPYLGMPVTVKDNFDLMGHPTTAGSRLLRDAPVARRDAVVVQRLRAAGFVLLGRTNMTEFAFSGLGINPHFGTPANPAYPGELRIPGGSSSGAAVSVALGLTRVAVGTDTGGSIRIPAALCGVTGFKPTAAAISRDGVLPLSTTLDAVGIIGESAADCRALFDVLRDVPGKPFAVPAHRIRLGVVTNYVMEGVQPEVAGPFHAALARLGAAGVAIEPIELPPLDRLPSLVKDATFPASESAAWHQSYLDAGRGAEYDPKVLARIEAGNRMGAAAYARLVEGRKAFIANMAEQLNGLHGIVWPTVPVLAPSISELEDDAAYHAANALMLRNSTIANLLDGCAISLPCPEAARPVGLTIAALAGSDDLLLGVAETCQGVLNQKD
ncbi:amidase [Sphingomonas sp. SKA58]|uniref:amidase n=1 Tax=Sphingomonas sp. (strain SKA58) TaxID=314266 RepID=UPI0000D7B7FE|nr:amidase [Sphingomonas sp. SKA58]EAT08838.1 amidase [Sphingomonas sp. SKA58]